MNSAPTPASDDLLFLQSELINIAPFELVDPSQLVVIEDGPLKGMAFLPPHPVFVASDGRIWFDVPR